MTTTEFIVIKVMGWGDFYAASTKFDINIIIGNDRHNATSNRQGNGFANQMRVTLVLWIDGNGGIAQQGFRARGSDNQIVLTILGCDIFLSEVIAKMPQAALFIDVFNF